jgi:hypothetical protein
MSDFFTRLAERTLGLALTIQPIKPSLFASELDYDGELEITEESATVQAYSDPQPTAEMPAPLSDYGRKPEPPHSSERVAPQPLGPSVTMSMNVSQTQGDTHPLIRHSHRLPAMEPATQAPGKHETDPAMRQSPIPISQTERGALDSLLSLSSTEEHNDDVAKRSNMSESNPLLDGDNMLERSTEATAIIETSTILHEKKIFHKQPMLHRVTMDERSGLQLPTSLSASQARLTASTPEPTIQVTIGRVEVRAVTSPTPAGRQSQQTTRSSAMTLDEYLRRQEQGGRR